MSVRNLIIFSLASLLIRFARASDDLPFMHAQCNEFEDAFNPTQLPYPNDCTKFYKCSGGFAFPMSCPRGLHWSVATNRCEFPSVAGCDKNIVVSTRTPSTGDAKDNRNGVVTSDCPIGENPNNPTQLAYPGDCTRFYKCEAGFAYLINCPMGLHWSTALNRCDWPSVANCKWSSVTPAPVLRPTSTPAPVIVPGPTSTPAPVIVPGPTSTPAPVIVPGPTSTPAPAPVIVPGPTSSTPAPAPTDISDIDAYCKSKIRNSGYLPYPGDCKRFVQCSNGKGYIQSCPGTLLFNSKLLACARFCN